MSKCEVVANIRDATELQKVINAWLKDGWTLNSTYPVSGAGYVGVSFIAVFTKEVP
jgi:hypothetical protein